MGVLFAIVIALATGYLKHARAEAENPQITVNFAESIHPVSMSGFLHSVNLPLPRSVVQPLKPVWWRLAPSELPAYLRGNHSARYIQVVLSDGYGYPFNGWQGKKAPWEGQGKQWEAYVANIAKRYRSLPNVVWDVWNEPDQVDDFEGTFWNGTQAQFFETYRRAYRVLKRELGPDAMIGGPSYASFRLEALRAFLNYCNDNGLEVNVLSWHEVDDPDTEISEVASHIRQVRALAREYPALNIRKIVINESVGRVATQKTGDMAAYLYYLEQGGADGAVKACWKSADDTNDCYNGTLDGLLASKTKQPRSAWWVYKFYADGMDSRVAVMRHDTETVAMASRNPSQILLGTGDDASAVQLKLEHVDTFLKHPQPKKTQVTLYALSNQGERPLGKPVFVSRQVLPVSGQSAVLNLGVLKPHTAYVIQLR